MLSELRPAIRNQTRSSRKSKLLNTVPRWKSVVNQIISDRRKSRRKQGEGNDVLLCLENRFCRIWLEVVKKYDDDGDGGGGGDDDDDDDNDDDNDDNDEEAVKGNSLVEDSDDAGDLRGGLCFKFRCWLKVSSSLCH